MAAQRTRDQPLGIISSVSDAFGGGVPLHRQNIHETRTAARLCGFFVFTLDLFFKNIKVEFLHQQLAKVCPNCAQTFLFLP